MSLTIAKIRTEDIEEKFKEMLITYHHQGAYDQIANYLKTMPQVVWGYFAILDGEIAGEITIMDERSDTNAEIYILSLTVVEKFRRRGIATFLLNHIFQEIPDVDYYSLHTQSSNLASQALYKKLGFEVVEVVPEAYGEESGVLMKLYSETGRVRLALRQPLIPVKVCPPRKPLISDSLRRITRDDGPTLLNLYQANYSSEFDGETICRALKESRIEFCRGYFALCDGEVVGELLYSWHNVYANIMSLSVRKEFRKRGIASLLLRQFFDEVVDVDEWYVNVPPGSDEDVAMHIWNKLGFAKKDGFRGELLGLSVPKGEPIRYSEDQEFAKQLRTVPITPENVAEMRALHREKYSEEYVNTTGDAIARALAIPRLSVNGWLAFCGDEVAGEVTTMRNEFQKIMSLTVSDRFSEHATDVARFLLRHICGEFDVTEDRISIPSEEIPGVFPTRAFLEDSGFQVYTRDKNYYPDRRDALVFSHKRK